MSTFAVDGAPVPLMRMDHDDEALFRELMGAVEQVARRSAFTLGAEVDAFEREWAAFCGAADAIGVSSGTEALVLALRALEIGPGDEVVVPANSFIATAEAVSLVGATPRFADVDPATATVTAATVAPLIGARTRAIVPVHLYGRTVELDPLLELARGAGIALVEDAAQAHGARYRGQRVGALGTLGCFSFYPAKNLGAWGDGGAVVTDDPALAERVRLLRAHGEAVRYEHRIVGTTARLDAIQAAVLRVKLRRLEQANARRREIARQFDAALAGAAVVPPPPPSDGHDHVYHQYVVRCEQRDALRAQLAAHGVATGLHYPTPIHRTGAYRDAAVAEGSLPATEALARTICSLPMFPGLSDSEIARIADAVHAFDPQGGG
ncbi:MAG TPA: DegT/DnrJ/EryC1/StrS family aminotransferase [Conexibacter sp.]|nr:DegT/DnrJ/EryC1/StrS family aminotransferase [Conexibacter sp.]